MANHPAFDESARQRGLSKTVLTLLICIHISEKTPHAKTDLFNRSDPISVSLRRIP